jgi:hypothetical protein
MLFYILFSKEGFHGVVKDLEITGTGGLMEAMKL